MKPFATLVVVCLAISCGGSSAPTRPSDAQAPTLAGAVTETAPTTTTGIPGAMLTFTVGGNMGRSAVTDSDGRFAWSGLQAGQSTVAVSASGYQTMEFPVVIKSCEDSARLSTVSGVTDHHRDVQRHHQTRRSVVLRLGECVPTV